MQIGDLVMAIGPGTRFKSRLGLIKSRAEYENCFVVCFFDGKSPSKIAYHIDKLRKLTRSNKWQVKQESGSSQDKTS